jgi:F0F1-type ATP synthase assembly protein I
MPLNKGSERSKMAKKTTTPATTRKSLVHSDLLAGFVIGFVCGVLFLSFFGSMM